MGSYYSIKNTTNHPIDIVYGDVCHVISKKKKNLQPGETWKSPKCTLSLVQRVDIIQNGKFVSKRVWSGSTHKSVRKYTVDDFLKSWKQIKKISDISVCDVAERKFFSVIEKIPFLGWVYKPIRAIVYLCKGNGREALRSISFHFNLNFGRILLDYHKSIDAIPHRFHEGIWKGARPLSNFKVFRITLGRPLDAEHAAILIDGTIYQLNKFGKKTRISTSNDASEFNTYSWNFVSERSSKSPEQLREFAMQFDNHTYSLFPNSQTENCQTFVDKMVAFAL